MAAGMTRLRMVMWLPNCAVPERGKATEGDKQESAKILLARPRFKVIPAGRRGEEGWQKGKLLSRGYRRLIWGMQRENWGFA